ncbi:tyrosine-type recombinase/integrase [Blautia sp.]|uniref:tyrosine-type recombinase/integrase n=1 Tax=Blautia sp. TaxID=1955243 RepID=UPI003AB88F6E
MYMTVIVSLKHVKTLGILSFFFLLHTGLRIGEALALEWCDLDFKRKKIRVYKTLNRVTKYYDSKGNKLSERYSTVQITTPKKSQEISGELLIHF